MHDFCRTLAIHIYIIVYETFKLSAYVRTTFAAINQGENKM
jgi:hypothetical protein